MLYNFGKTEMRSHPVLCGSRHTKDQQQVKLRTLTTFQICQFINSNLQFKVPQSGRRQSAPFAVLNVGRNTDTLPCIALSCSDRAVQNDFQKDRVLHQDGCIQSIINYYKLRPE